MTIEELRAVAKTAKNKARVMWLAYTAACVAARSDNVRGIYRTADTEHDAYIDAMKEAYDALTALYAKEQP